MIPVKALACCCRFLSWMLRTWRSPIRVDAVGLEDALDPCAGMMELIVNLSHAQALFPQGKNLGRGHVVLVVLHPAFVYRTPSHIEAYPLEVLIDSGLRSASPPRYFSDACALAKQGFDFV